MRYPLGSTFCVALAAIGCHKPAPAPVPIVGQVVSKLMHVQPAELPQISGPELDRLVSEAAAAAAGPSTYRPPRPSPTPGAQLKVKLELTWEPPPAATLRADITASLEPRDNESGLASIQRAARVEKEDMAKLPSDADVLAHLRHALSLTVTSAMTAEQLWLSPPSAARQALSGTDTDLRDDAIRFCGERRDRDAVPQLVSLLKSEDVELRDRAIGALAEIGDPRAVKPLGELAKFGDLRELPKIIDAVSRVGGDEAVAYLEFVAGSHPVPQVQDLARRALEHLRADQRLRGDASVK